MSRSKNNKPILYKVEITDVAAEGKALGRVDDKVVFVTHTVPGDVVDVQVQRKRSNFYEGFPVKYHVYSPIRVEPVCSHFGTCGGCKWQSMPYAEQLKFKHNEVSNNLRRIGKVDLPEIQPILGSAKTEFYRNKLEFTFSNKRWLELSEISRAEEFNRNGLGFHIPGMFDKVLDVERCFLQDDPSNGIRDAVRNFCLEHNYTFFDIRGQEGMMRNLIIRTSSTGEVMVIVVFYFEDKEKREALLNHIADLFPQITALMYVINTKANDTITDMPVQLFKGQSFIYEEMEGLKFKIGPKSFYQTNSQQAYELYKITRDFAGLNGSEVVYDLYTGTGTIANFVAHQAQKVVGIEYVPEAIEDAKVNSEINGIQNTIFFAGDMKDILTRDFFETHGHPEVIITDPPRAGMHQDVVDSILNSAPEKIVYVSCNSATQARDIQLLSMRYRVTKVQPVDMFPHTHHVENVVLLERI